MHFSIHHCRALRVKSHFPAIGNAVELEVMREPVEQFFEEDGRFVGRAVAREPAIIALFGLSPEAVRALFEALGQPVVVGPPAQGAAHEAA